MFRMPSIACSRFAAPAPSSPAPCGAGSLARDEVVRSSLAMAGARRGLQAHGAAMDRAQPGTRLRSHSPAVDHDALARGRSRRRQRGWRSDRVLRADVTLLANTVAALSPAR